MPGWQVLQDELSATGFTVIAVALDDSAETSREWVDHSDPRPTYPVLVDPDHRIAELYGLYNVPSVVWIDETGHIARSPTIAPGTDIFKDFSGIESAVHHDQLRAWVLHGTLPYDAAELRDRQPLPTDELQQARTERRLAAWLHRHGHDSHARRHWEEAARLAPMDWTIRRGSLPLRGEDPFGQRFFEFYGEWEGAGRPGYGPAERR